MWQDIFKYDPVAPLIEYNNKAVALAAQRDLLGKKISSQDLWLLTWPQHILRKQNKNGSWEYPGTKEHGGDRYDTHEKGQIARL